MSKTIEERLTRIERHLFPDEVNPGEVYVFAVGDIVRNEDNATLCEIEEFMHKGEFAKLSGDLKGVLYHLSKLRPATPDEAAAYWKRKEWEKVDELQDKDW